jgi:hypothetical protein
MSEQAKMVELEEKCEAAIEVTEATNEILRSIDPDSPELQSRESKLIQLRGLLNCLRGFDAVFMGC